MADYFALMELGRLAKATGLSHSELNAMDGQRVRQLIVMNDAREEWLLDQAEKERG